jgi:hypothetical protein
MAPSGSLSISQAADGFNDFILLATIIIIETAFVPGRKRFVFRHYQNGLRDIIYSYLFLY